MLARSQSAPGAAAPLATPRSPLLRGASILALASLGLVAPWSLARGPSAAVLAASFVCLVLAWLALAVDTWRLGKRDGPPSGIRRAIVATIPLALPGFVVGGPLGALAAAALISLGWVVVSALVLVALVLGAVREHRAPQAWRRPG